MDPNLAMRLVIYSNMKAVSMGSIVTQSTGSPNCQSKIGAPLIEALQRCEVNETNYNVCQRVPVRIHP